MDIKNNKLFRKLSVLLAMAMILALPTAAFADWDTYGGNNEHNAVVSDAPTSSNPSVVAHQLTKNGNGWDGVDNVPVMRTVGNTTYAYVLYDGYRVAGNNGGGRLTKINCDTGAEVWNIQVEPQAGFQLSTPLLVKGATEAEDVLYIGTSNAGQVLSPLNASNWNISGASFQNDELIVPNGGTATLTTNNFDLQANSLKRVALGIYLGTDPNVQASATVTWNVNGTVGNKTFNSSNVLQDGDTGRYYFYLNENIGSVPPSGENQISYTVNINGVDGKIAYASLYDQVGSIQKVTNLGGELPSWQKIPGLTAINGQINTPITTDGTYLYFGTWQGGSNQGKYYQIKMSNNSVKEFTPNSHGFYWAGAVCDDDNVYFGSDDGKIYWRSRSRFNSDGDVLDLKTAPNGASNADNVRSTIMKDSDGKLYFTSQGGYLWCCKFEDGSLQIDWKKKIVDTGYVKSTSTPTKVGDRIYIGYYQGFNAGGVKCISASGNHAVETIATGFPVQSSVIVKGDGTGTDYIYFNTNSGTGAGYCYSYTGGNSGTKIWNTTLDNYALGGMACENGYIVFGNDKNRLYIVK